MTGFTGATGRFSHFGVVLGRAGRAHEKEHRVVNKQTGESLRFFPFQRCWASILGGRAPSRWKQDVFRRTCPQLQDSEFSGALDVWKWIATTQRPCVPFFKGIMMYLKGLQEPAYVLSGLASWLDDSKDPEQTSALTTSIPAVFSL